MFDRLRAMLLFMENTEKSTTCLRGIWFGSVGIKKHEQHPIVYEYFVLDSSWHFYYFHKLSMTKGFEGTSSMFSGLGRPCYPNQLCSTWDVDDEEFWYFDPHHVLPLLSLLLHAPWTFPYLCLTPDWIPSFWRFFIDIAHSVHSPAVLILIFTCHGM